MPDHGSEHRRSPGQGSGSLAVAAAALAAAAAFAPCAAEDSQTARSSSGTRRERFPSRQESVSLPHLRSGPAWENGV
jgi:hypothetical protein